MLFSTCAYAVQKSNLHTESDCSGQAQWLIIQNVAGEMITSPSMFSYLLRQRFSKNSL